MKILTLDEIKGVFTEDELLLIAATCGTLSEWFNIEPYQLANPSLLTDYLYTPELVDLSKEMNCSVNFIEMVRKVESLTPAQMYFLNDWLFEALGGDLMACLQELAA